MRIRTIKPEFWTDGTISTLTPKARLLFIGCWNLADDEGLLRWDAGYLKGALFPFDEQFKIAHTKLCMSELTTKNLVIEYSTHDFQLLACIVNFRKHQRINRPTPSMLPRPTDEQRAEFANRKASNNKRQKLSSLTEDSVSEQTSDSLRPHCGKGRERKGKERKCSFTESLTESSVREQFEQFWNSYPRKQAKGDARKAYEQAVRQTAPAVIQAAAQRYAAATRDIERKFVKLPAGWLRDERWLDEVAGNGSGDASSAKIQATAARFAERSEEEMQRRKELGLDGLH